MADTDWALRDIGRAKSTVKLGYLKYDQDKINHHYQEAWIDSVSTVQQSDLKRLFPADHFNNSFESTSTNWETVPQIGGIKLKPIENPEAPRETLIRGFLGETVSLVPDMVAANSEYVPVFTDIEGNSSVLPNMGGSDTSVTFFPQFADSPGVSAVAVQSELLNDTPFIPSSIDSLANDATSYVKRIQRDGIKVHNFWEMGHPSMTDDKRQYLQNYGPIWGSAPYSGAIAAQVGSVGNFRVKVSANRSSAMLYRTAPIHRDIGRDKSYPWIYPKVLDNNISHA